MSRTNFVLPQPLTTLIQAIGSNQPLLTAPSTSETRTPAEIPTHTEPSGLDESNDGQGAFELVLVQA